MAVRGVIGVGLLGVLAWLFVPGCSGGADPAVSDAGTCKRISPDGGEVAYRYTCPIWRCTCETGEIATTASCSNAECPSGQDACTRVCSGSGGLKSYEEVPDPTKSAECAAFCAKVAALGCGTCDKSFWCHLGAGECADSKRALLACEATTGAWQCNPDGSFTVTSSCVEPACATDAGSDAAPEASGSDASGSDATAE